MALSIGNPTITIEDILSNISLEDILVYYFDIKEIPCVIQSPLRQDSNPSFGIQIVNGKIRYKDFSTGETGGVLDMLMKKWSCNYAKMLYKLNNDVPKIAGKLGREITKSLSPKNTNTIKIRSKSDLKCKIRKWLQRDVDYWNQYGISLKWLKLAEVYPISHKIIVKDNRTYILPADKLAYAYVEHKEGKVTLKIYQPYNKNGYKWSNKHDKSVISLWTKVPKCGDKICICSSLKDALCLWANANIPSIAIQGEGYTMSNTAINELKRRYNKVYILLDNDKAGIKDALKLSESTGFINLVLPHFENGKDISDLFKVKGKEEWLKIILPLFE